MKIDKTKPLPDHTKLNYDECCAKLVLEELFPEKYHDLLISDKPDLQGLNVGIEVTNADNEEHREALKLWYTMPYVDDNKKSRNIARMAQLGVKYTGGIQLWPSFSPKFDAVQQTILNKRQKLNNGNYKLFNRNELFVFTDTWFTDEVIAKAKDFLFTENTTGDFQVIYVLSQGVNLHIFDVLTRSYRYIQIDTSEQSNRNIRARQMIENAEEK